MSYVFVLDTNKQPLNPVHPGWARKLCSSGRAAVYKRYPFTIILKCAVQDAEVQPLRLKIDPGSKTTGLAIVNDDTGDVVFAAELQHRGHNIKESLDSRRAIRRGRRSRKTRYRKPRFNNRKRKEGWLPPSLMSRIYNIETWIALWARRGGKSAGRKRGEAYSSAFTFLPILLSDRYNHQLDAISCSADS